MSAPSFTVQYGAATHRGLVRAGNEDSYLTVPPIFLVADGMGGHARGEAASQAVVDSFLDLSTRTWLSAEDLTAAVERAVRAVQALADVDHAPGSTLTGVGLAEQGGMPCWMVFNVGDSRTHLLRGGELTQVSVDHSATVKDGSRNVITRAIGGGLTSPTVDRWLIPAQVGDRVMMCSDGLSGEVTTELISATLQATPDPQEAARALLEAALRAGGHDNVTVLVVDCTSLDSTARAGAFVDETASDETVPDQEWA